MSRSAILVLTTVHSPDDTRIRERLIRSLQPLGEISYATKQPGPSDLSGLDWIPLPGGRIRRNLAAIGLLLRRRWDLAVLHDPETIPAGVLGRLRGTRVVFDVHEDLPAQIDSKTWAPIWAKPVLRLLARSLYWLAGRALRLTLAEPGYQRMFKGDLPVFPNYPRSDTFPRPGSAGDGSAIYVGDVTRARGLEDAVEACGLASVPLVIVGRVDPGIRPGLEQSAHAPELTGPLPNPAAMELIGGSSVGLSMLRDVPNYRDSLPTKTLEYLAMGVPVVATDLPGTRAVLDDLDAVWLVPPGDITAAAEAIVEAVRPQAKTKALAQVPVVRDIFRWPEEEVTTFYSNLIRAAGTPDPS
jgi:glycosyltransferase involved in cell wall biosynthesis